MISVIEISNIVSIGITSTNGVETVEVAPMISMAVYGTSSFNFTQATPASTWTINHNLGFNPSCEIFSTGGVGVDAELHHISINQLTVNFSTPFAGYARLN